MASAVLSMLLPSLGATEFDAAEVAARYGRELYGRVVPFWTAHSIDRDCGGCGGGCGCH